MVRVRAGRMIPTAIAELGRVKDLPAGAAGTEWVIAIAH